MIDKYFIFLMKIVGLSQAKEYIGVIKHLFMEEFIWNTDNNSLDDQRKFGARYLREEWCDAHGYGYSSLYDAMMIECSWLEALIGLARQVEHDITHDESKGDRTSVWFWEMLKNLGLTGPRLKGDNVDIMYIEHCLNRFTNRDYNPDGSNGGLFVVSKEDSYKYFNDVVDLRKADMWGQINMWLTVQYKKHKI